MVGITEFVEKNPQMVKGIMAGVAAFGFLTAAVVVYTAVTKIADAVSKAFATTATISLGPFMALAAAFAAIVGILVATSEEMETEEERINALTVASREQYYELQNLETQYDNIVEKYGETSAEAQLLKKEVEQCTAAYEANKETVAEAAARHDEIIAAYRETAAASREIYQAINSEEQSAYSLISRLNELMTVEGKTAATKQEILAVVELLNEAMPELGLAYDEYADSLNMTADAIRTLAEAEAAQQRNEAAYQDMINRINDATDLEKALTNAKNERAGAEERLAEATQTLATAQKNIHDDQSYGKGAADLLGKYENAVRAVQEEVDDWAAKESEVKNAIEENERQISLLSEAMADYADEQSNVVDGSVEAQMAASEMTAALQELNEAYEESYNAALSSIQAIKRGMVNGDGKAAATPDNVRPESYLKRDEAVRMILEAEKSK